ncbi:hypothetical protein [Bradyrhizobium ottawaense]|uniref:hypothetical protein n=1 Tax=Bradyrhizobium ottawaense TaxID=931866 RepID=UPI003833811D
MLNRDLARTYSPLLPGAGPKPTGDGGERQGRFLPDWPEPRNRGSGFFLEQMASDRVDPRHQDCGSGNQSASVDSSMEMSSWQTQP